MSDETRKPVPDRVIADAKLVFAGAEQGVLPEGAGKGDLLETVRLVATVAGGLDKLYIPEDRWLAVAGEPFYPSKNIVVTGRQLNS